MDQQLNPRDLKYFRSLKWTLQTWKPTPALIEKKGANARPYIGQGYDPVFFDLVEDGWRHDHCEVCFVKLCDNPETCQTEGYTADRQWLCRECYEQNVAVSSRLRS
ncbi:hypothetical protein GCM10023184_00160 [Flaviaesturariibacter amylovorans]|uniref:Zinc finger PHD-type domain-containing protein n=1 Tax=Flaviaesturariibacter amylovorans TaxID=1084520 RepID=A0ABP8G3L7_9BACT